MQIIRQGVNKNENQIDCILREDIENLNKNYKIDLKSLSRITGIDYAYLKEFMDGKNIYIDFFNNLRNSTENNRENLNNSNIADPLALSSMVSMLSYGKINEDERVKAIIDVLISEFEINNETLAIYSGVEVEDVQSFMEDTNSISIEKKYKLAVASLFLHYLFKQPEKK